jgi:hypothetical protein
MFEDANTPKPRYEKLAKHATLCFSVEDVLTFLGRKLYGDYWVHSELLRCWDSVADLISS